MSLSERQQQFKAGIASQPEVTAKARIAENFGFSNSARIIEGGLFACTNNLESYSAKLVADPSQAVPQFVFLCVLTFPPNDEVYFAIVVNDAAGVNNRLIQLAREVKERNKQRLEVGKKAGSINNNVKFYITEGGKLFFHNDEFMEFLNVAKLDEDCLAAIDGILFSIYPPSVSARRSLLAREFVGYLGRLVGKERIHEIEVWPTEASVGPLMRRMPAIIPVADIRAAIEGLGGHYVDELVERYHTALNFHPTKHFVILAGLSGTGKTQLALKYARAVHGIAGNTEADPLLYICPVRPEWTDPTGLTGYNDVLSNRYMVPPFLEAVLVATAWRDSPVFVVLDEMNLARVEYYFSDVLSAIETGAPLQLHPSAVPLEGSTGGEIRAEIPLPPNLFITGTINVDETTNPVSDKVLDRASLIDMSAVDLPGFLSKLTASSPDLEASAGICEPVLTRLHGLLAPHRLAFGYRLAEEFIRYHAFAVTAAGRGSDQVIGEAISQKILVRLRGTEAQRSLLEALRAELARWPRSAVVIERLAADLDETGSFQNTR